MLDSTGGVAKGQRRGRHEPFSGKPTIRELDAGPEKTGAFGEVGISGDRRYSLAPKEVKQFGEVL